MRTVVLERRVLEHAERHARLLADVRAAPGDELGVVRVGVLLRVEIVAVFALAAAPRAPPLLLERSRVRVVHLLALAPATRDAAVAPVRARVRDVVDLVRVRVRVLGTRRPLAAAAVAAIVVVVVVVDHGRVGARLVARSLALELRLGLPRLARVVRVRAAVEPRARRLRGLRLRRAGERLDAAVARALARALAALVLPPRAARALALKLVLAS